MQPRHQCNLHAAIPMRSAPQLQETHRTTHTGTTTRCKTHRRNNSRQKRPQPHPPQDEVPFTNHYNRAPACHMPASGKPASMATVSDATNIPKIYQPHPSHLPFIGCSHFTRKNTRFRAPASSPKHSPCNIHAAIPMRSATTASRNA